MNVQPAHLFLEVGEAQAAFEKLHRRLLQVGFPALERYPWPGGWSRIVFEPAIFFRWWTGQSNCWQTSPMARIYSNVLRRTNPSLALLQQAFIYCEPVPATALETLLSAELCRELQEAGLLRAANGSLISGARATPWQGKIYWHDPPPNFRESFVFLGADSVSFAHHLATELKRSPQRRYGRVLDLCTGSGLHALMLSKRAEEVIGADLNPRAIAYAQLNAHLQEALNVRFLISDLLEQVPAGRYDLVVSNMPLLFLPEPLRSKCLDGDAGEMGIGLPLRLIDQLGDRLTPHGVALLHVNSPMVDGRDLLIENIRQQFADRHWLVEFQPTHEFYDPTYDALYRAHRIQRFVTYRLRISAGTKGPLRCRRLTLPILHKTACRIRIATVRRR